jgi:hypothetical protein
MKTYVFFKQPDTQFVMAQNHDDCIHGSLTPTIYSRLLTHVNEASMRAPY